MAALFLGMRIVSMAVFLIFLLELLSAQCLDKNGNIFYSGTLYKPEGHLSSKSRLKMTLLSIALGSLTGMIIAGFFVFMVGKLFRYINRKSFLKSPLVFSPKISPETLTLALSNEPQLLGSSSNGKYYKVVLDNGLTVAVKRLEPFQDQFTGGQGLGMRRKMKQELVNLTGLRHRNLMSLRTYVCEPGGRYCLVYDYIPTGSLEDAMRRVREHHLELKWSFRLRIAVGVAKGLHYLHFVCDPRRLHHNLKPSNVLLDCEFEPRLADCGLVDIFPNSCRGGSTVYIAPECLQDCRYTDKSDVFNFGVILATLLTGRDPLDPSFGESSSGASLGQWLRRRQQAGESRGALDRSILGEEMEESEMLMALRICTACLSYLPADRPSSDELVSMLTQLNSF